MNFISRFFVLLYETKIYTAMIHTPKFCFTKNKTHYYLAFVLCVIGAFIIYALSYYMREILRLFSIDWYYRTIYTLNENEHFFYNFFYACFSCIIAFNVFLLYVFNKPKQFLQRKRYLQLAGVHDVRFTSWLFVFFFTTIFFDWWMFTKGIPHDFSLAQNYWYFFALILLVLFLNSYTNLQRILPKRSFKYFFILLVSIISVSLSFTFIELSGYAQFEQKFNQLNIYSQNDFLQLTSSAAKPIESKTWSFPLFVMKDEHNNEINVYNRYHSYPIENLALYLRDSVATKYSKKEMQLLEPNLHFNADLTMGEFLEVYKQIKEGLGSGKVAYAINTEKLNQQTAFKDNLQSIETIGFEKLDYENVIQLKQTAQQKLELDGVVVEINELQSLIFNRVENLENPIIQFAIHPDAKFTHYLSTKSVLTELKSIYVRQHLDTIDFQSFDRAAERKIAQKTIFKTIHQIDLNELAF